MLDYLIEFSRREEVQQIVSQASEYESVQGVILEIDPSWIWLWKIKERFGQQAIDRGFYEYYPEFGPFMHEIYDIKLYSPIRSSDLHWRPDFYQELIYLKKTKSREHDPIRVRICLYPYDPEKETNETPNIEQEQLTIVYERRPVSRFVSSKSMFRPLIGGISIGVDKSSFATLGGILSDGTVDYGVSCSHVVNLNDNVDQPAFIDSKSSNSIGNVVYKSQLITSPNNGICNPWNNASIVNEMDVALIEIDGATKSMYEINDIGPVDGLAGLATLSPGLALEFSGRSSSYSTLEIGGLGVMQKISHDSGDYCFSNLVELKSPSFWRNLVRSPIKPGDSGSWATIAQGKNNNWAGLIIAGDRHTGYMIPSELVLDHLNNNFSSGLLVKS